MTQKIPVLIYGDSIMKATVVEQGGKMKFTFQQYVQQLEQAGLEVCNRAKFGATVDKGRQAMEQDLKKGVTAGMRFCVSAATIVTTTGRRWPPRRRRYTSRTRC